MNDLATTLKALAKAQNAANPHPVVADLSSPVGENPPVFAKGAGLRDHVETLLAKSAGAASGWLLWSEELQIIHGGTPFLLGEGWLLSGEIYIPADSNTKTPDQTHVIRQKGRDWEIRTLVRTESPSVSTDGLPSAFMEVRELLPWPQLKTLAGRKLCYEVAWRLNASLPTPCYRPADCRFVGFTTPTSPEL